MDPTIVSREYGFLQADPSVYVNTCTVGIPPACTQAAGNRFMAGYTDYAMGMDFDRYERLRANVRGMLAGLIGGEGEEIALTKNTTEGVCILAAGYPLGPGDNVVTWKTSQTSSPGSTMPG